MSEKIVLVGNISAKKEPVTAKKKEEIKDKKGKSASYSPEERPQNSALKDLFALLIFPPNILGGCAAAGKNPQDLSPDEQEAMENLLFEVYKKTFNLDESDKQNFNYQAMFFKTEIMLHPKTYKKLDRPIKTISIWIQPWVTDKHPEFEKDIEKNLEALGMKWKANGKTKAIHINDAKIEMIPGSIGMGATRDMITICPLKVEVTEE